MLSTSERTGGYPSSTSTIRKNRSKNRSQTYPSQEGKARAGSRWCSLQIPCTDEVQKQLSLGGPSTSFLDVALGIIERLQENSSNNLSEVLFLRDCLKAGPDVIGLPCALVNRAKEQSCNQSDRAGSPDSSESLDHIFRTYASRSASSPRNGNAFRQGTQQLDSRKFPVVAANEPDSLAQNPVLSIEGSAAGEIKELMKASFDDWSFDAFKLFKLAGGRALQIMGWEALERRGHFSEFGMQPAKTRKFLERVEASYRDEAAAPYHNSMHAADVAQTVHSLLANIGFRSFFEQMSCLTVVLGAIIHDMGHDGHTNQFHITTRSDLAIRYNDQSVLENYHVSEAFRILQKDVDANMFSAFSEDLFQRARRDLIKVVLGTDMAMHFKNLSSLKSAAERIGSEASDWRADPTALSELHVAVLHAADLGPQAKPTHLSFNWAERVKQEFYKQGDDERRLGVPISSLCDRDTAKFANSQVGFIEYIVQPLFVTLALALPRVDEICRPEVDVNLEAWNKLKALEASPEADKKPEASRSPAGRGRTVHL